MSYTLGFIGAGNMAEAIARAAVEQGVVDASKLIASDPTAERRDIFSSLGIATADDNAQVLSQADQVMLAVKPQMLDAIAAALAEHARQEQVLISIMAGITSKRLGDAINQARVQAGKDAVAWRIVRVMPNTPMLVGQGMAGVALGENAQQGDDALSLELFGAGGKAVAVEEVKIDAITAVSGSGPAYLFYLAEGMQAAARELGLEGEAELLVSQTLLGAATLLAESDDTAAELRRKVTSPGGTTEAAIKHFDSQSTQQTIVDALKAAHARSLELGKGQR